MSLAYRSPVVPAAFGLLLFYWTALSAYGLWTRGWDLSLDWIQPGSAMLGQVAIGIGVGAVVGLGAAGIRRRLLKLQILGDAEAGVACNLGALPQQPTPKRLSAISAMPGMRLPQGVGNWHGKWLRSAREHRVRGQTRGTIYADVVEALLKVLGAHADVPAGVYRPSLVTPAEDEGEPPTSPDEAAAKPRSIASLRHQLLRRVQPPSGQAQVHGGHTLLEHSYSTAYLALALAGTWSFDQAVEQWNRAERGRKTYRRIGRKNGAYRFKANDPLVPIIALAHDLGKLATYRTKENGTWHVTREDHDRLSAHLMMRLPEFRALPRRERRIALLVLGNYHRAGELRRHIEHVGYEDRVFTLLQLLILADRRAGLVEIGQQEEADDDSDTANDQQAQWRGMIWAAFSRLITEANRISTKHNRYRIGQKNELRRDQPVIVLNELTVRKELERVLPRECLRYAQARVGSDVNGLTALLLEVLDQHNVLIKQQGNYSVAAESAVWMVDFRGKDKERTEPIARWRYAILLDPRIAFPHLCEHANADSVPIIVGPSGNRNEGLLVGVSAPETGIDPLIEFEDDGNAPQDDEESPIGVEQGAASKAQSTIFSDSAMQSALPEMPPEIAGLFKSKRVPRSRRSSARQQAGAAEGGHAAKRRAADGDALSVAMRELSIDVANGIVPGARLAEDGVGWLVPLLAATRVPSGKILLDPTVGQRLANNTLNGVDVVQEEDGVYLRLRMEPVAETPLQRQLL